VAGNITANNLSSVQQYAFTDDVAAISSKYIYYRIRIVDLDHSMKLTNSISVKTAEPRNNTMTISPNPSSAEAQVKIKLTKAGTGALVVFDASGKTVLKQQVNLSAGSNSVVINNSNSFAEGYYTVRLIVNEESFSSKLLIWK
jgi:hypothetical protein